MANIIERIKSKIASLAAEACYGCSVDHPSQLHHDWCVMASDDDILRTFFTEAHHHILIEELKNMNKEKKALKRAHTMVIASAQHQVYEFKKSRTAELGILRVDHHNRILRLGVITEDDIKQ